MVAVKLQLSTFLVMLAIGLVIGIGFEFYQLLRRKFSWGRLITDLGDILFSLIATLIISGGLLYLNSGQLRIYFLIGVVIGLIIYYYFFSPLVLNLFSLVANLVARFETVITKFKDGADTDG